MSTLTTANSILLLSVAGLYPVPVPIQGYSVDDAFSTEEAENGELMIGIDGQLSAGYTPYITPVTITLQANSLSNSVMDAWIGAERKSREKYVASVTILIPSIGDLIDCETGYLQKFQAFAEGKKVLQPRKFTIGFESVTRGPA